MRSYLSPPRRFPLLTHVLIIVALIGIPLFVSPDHAEATWPGCGIAITLVTDHPRVEISSSSPQLVAIARFTCATPRVRTVELCLTPTIGDGACTTRTVTERRGVLTARCLLSPAVGDRWTATARLTDPVLGTRQVEAVLIAELSAGCVTREGVAAMS